MALITSLDPGARAWTGKVSCIGVVDCPVAVVITKYLRLYPVGTLLLAGGIVCAEKTIVRGVTVAKRRRSRINERA
eukprot:scaffold9929_cov96-Amphora_coffeaeformis.AAC.2